MQWPGYDPQSGMMMADMPPWMMKGKGMGPMGFGGKGKPGNWAGGQGWGGGGKGGGGGGGQSYGNIHGLDQALEEALGAEAALDLSYPLEELKKRVFQKIAKAVRKFKEDERVSYQGSATLAKLLVEEFVDSALGALSAAYSDTLWFQKVNFTSVLLLAAKYTFIGTKAFSRTVTPLMPSLVDDSIHRWQEEERIQKGVWSALESVTLTDSHRKKANNHLLKAFDEAHSKAPYGESVGDTLQMGTIKDFLKGWMIEFIKRSWDVLQNGANANSRDEQILFVTILFQRLVDPANCCLPHDLTSLVDAIPPAPWAFVAEAAEEIFNKFEADNQAEGPPAKRLKGCGGKGFGF